MQLIPHVGAAAGRAKPGDAQRGTVPVSQRLEVVELVDVVAGDHDRDLGVSESGRGEVLQRADRHREGADTPYGIVDLRGGAVQRDLDVDIVTGRQPRRHLRGDANAVGGELDPDVVRGGVVHQLPEVGAHRGFAAADVHVEHLHAFQLVDDRLALSRGQLTRVALARRGQAVHTGQVAGVGQFPGQADRRVEAAFELFDQPGHRRGGGQGISKSDRRGTNMFDSTSTPRACR